MPFLSLQFKAVGYNGVQISLLNMLSALAVILTAPQYGLIFDRSKDKRLILLISLTIVTMTLFLIPYLRAFGAMLVIYTINRVIVSSSITASENLSYQVSADKNGEEKPLWQPAHVGLVGLCTDSFTRRYDFPKLWLITQ